MACGGSDVDVVSPPSALKHPSFAALQGTAFMDRPKKNAPWKRDIFFNASGVFKDANGQEVPHGHAVVSNDSQGNLVFHYVRDIVAGSFKGDVYIDDRKK